MNNKITDCIVLITQEREAVQAQLDGVMLILSVAEKARHNPSAWTAETWEAGIDTKLAPYYAERINLIKTLEHLDGTLAYLQTKE